MSSKQSRRRCLAYDSVVRHHGREFEKFLTLKGVTMKYWKVKHGTPVHEWCVSFGNEYQIVNEKRIALCKTVIPGRKKIVPIVNSNSFVGMRYLRGELPETTPDPRLVISKHKTVEGKNYYVPHKKNKASKQLWQAMEMLRQNSTAPLCGILGITPVIFDSRGLRSSILVFDTSSAMERFISRRSTRSRGTKTSSGLQTWNMSHFPSDNKD